MKIHLSLNSSFKKVRKTFALVTSLVLILPFVLVSNVIGATTGTVSATVTVQNVSVTVADGTVAYGTLGLNSSAGTNSADTQTATNNGNVAETLTIKGANSANWTLSATNSTTDTYIHKFCTATCGSAPTNYTSLTTSYQTLNASVAASGTQTFDLYLTTPQTSSVYTSQSVDVTVLAAAL